MEVLLRLKLVAKFHSELIVVYNSSNTKAVCIEGVYSINVAEIHCRDVCVACTIILDALKCINRYKYALLGYNFQ